MESTNLYIPVNIKTRFEFFNGYGITELIQTIIAAVVSGFAAFTAYTITSGTTVPVLIVLVTIAAAVTAFTKGESNQSVTDQIGHIVRFMREQRIYAYYYTDEWGNDIDK
jgi:hypothetical protein